MSINLQTQYKTSDGSTFEKKEDAIIHEASIHLRAGMVPKSSTLCDVKGENLEKMKELLPAFLHFLNDNLGEYDSASGDVVYFADLLEANF